MPTRPLHHLYIPCNQAETSKSRKENSITLVPNVFENVKTDLPEACPVCHMITEVRLYDAIQLYDSVIVAAFLMRFIYKWETE